MGAVSYMFARQRIMCDASATSSELPNSWIITYSSPTLFNHIRSANGGLRRLQQQTKRALCSRCRKCTEITMQSTTKLSHSTFQIQHHLIVLGNTQWWNAPLKGWCHSCCP